MLRKIVVRSVRNAPKFAPTECKFILEVRRRFGIEAKLFGGVVAQVEIFLFHTEGKEPIAAEIFPVSKPFEVCAGLAEEFQLHLFKFAGAEREVAGGNFVAERFTDLTDTERHAQTGGTLYVREVYENTLRRFGTEVYGVCRIFRNALERLEHQIEFTDRGEIGVSADRTNDLMLGNKRFQSVVVHRLYFNVQTFFCYVIFHEIIRAVTGFTALTIHQGIGETAKVTRSLPSTRIHQDCTIHARVVRVFLNEFFPPSFLDVVFQLHAQRTVVPRVRKPAVDFAAGENEASVLAKGNEFFHRYRSFFSHSALLTTHLRNLIRFISYIIQCFPVQVKSLGGDFLKILDFPT